MHLLLFFFFFKQKTADEMRISDWSSDVCSSDLVAIVDLGRERGGGVPADAGKGAQIIGPSVARDDHSALPQPAGPARIAEPVPGGDHGRRPDRKSVV